MDGDHELIAQGIGNLIIPFFGGVPATGAVARTRVGIASGGLSRLATIFHALILLSVIVAAGPVLERIPVAALAGVLVVTTIRMNDWSDIRWMFRHRFKSAILGFWVTLIATATFDLTTAILIGVGLSAVLFISRLSEVDVTRTDVNVKLLEDRGYHIHGNTQDIGVAYVTGPLFFAATANFRKAFDTDKRYRYLVLSMRGVPIIDVSGLELIEELWERKRKLGGELLLCGVQPNVKKMLDRAGLTQEIGEDKFFWSADQAILAINSRINKPSELPLGNG
jgi:SulP family sulfate permease